MKTDVRPKVGLLLLGSRRFHDLGEGTRRGPYHSRKAVHAEAMQRSLQPGLDVRFPGIVYDEADLARALAMLHGAEVDFVMAEFLSWSEDAAWIRYLRDAAGLPLLFTHTTRSEAGFRDTEAEDDFIEFLAEGGLVGTLEASGSLRRIDGRSVKVVIGGADRVAGEAFLFGRAAAIRSALRKATIGLLANFNELMWSTYVDPYNVFARLGPRIRFLPYSDLALEIKDVADSDARRWVGELKERHAVVGDVEEALFLESARASLALGRMAARTELDILALNDIDHALFRSIGLRPGFYPGWFDDNGSVLVPEADIGAGVATFLLKRFSGKRVNFIEPFYIEASTGCFVAGHAGPNDHTDPEVAGRVKIARDVRFAKSGYRYAGAPFAWYRFAPGLKTMAHFSEHNSRYKLLCTLVETLEGEHFITGYSHGVFRPRVPVEPLFERIAEIGTTQHFAIVDGDYRRELESLGRAADLDFHLLE